MGWTEQLSGSCCLDNWFLTKCSHERITPSASLTNICSSSKVTRISVSKISIRSLSTRDRAFSKSKLLYFLQALSPVAMAQTNCLVVLLCALEVVIEDDLSTLI